MSNYSIKTNELWDTLVTYSVEADSLEEALQMIVDCEVPADDHEHGIGDDIVLAALTAFEDGHPISDERLHNEAKKTIGTVNSVWDIELE